MLKFISPAQPSVIQQFNVLPTPTSSASAIGENTIKPNPVKSIFDSTKKASIMKLSLPKPTFSPEMKKKDAPVPQQDTLTYFSKTKSSNVLKEGINFTVGRTYPKKEVKMNKVKLSNFYVGKTDTPSMLVFC